MLFVARALMFVGIGWIGLSTAVVFWFAIWGTYMGLPWTDNVASFFLVILISVFGGIMNGLPALGLILIGAVLSWFAPAAGRR